MAQPDFRFMSRHPVHVLSLGFGAGLAPIAPGTLGTLLAFPLYWLMAGLPAWAYLAAVAALFAAGVAAAGFTSAALGVHDHRAIVIDEVAGMLLGLFHLPAGAPGGWVWLVLAFLLFRALDVLKPWPISWADRRVAGGFGIMLDDLLAGVFTLAVMQALLWVAGA